MSLKRVETIQNRLYELLRVKEITAAELCAKTGISAPVFSRYLNGQREPRQDKIAIIAEACNINPAWLIGFDAPMNNPSPEDKQEEQRAAEMWRRLDNYQRKIVLGLMDGLLTKKD